MKPIRLEFNAFGPFAGNEVVDFEVVADAGIFLISGPTGAGKTTIFDGICFALYGEASGTLRQNEDFKSDFADPSALCSVRYLFSVREKQFAVYRAPKQHKQKKNGDMTIVAAKAELTLPDQSVVTGPAAVSARIQEILGLSVKQFKQITMLAQGDFRRFLDAPSNEKQEIFRHIFDTEKFDRFTTLLERESKSSLERIEKEQQLLSFHLQSLSVREDETLRALQTAEFPVVPPLLERLSVLLASDQEELARRQECIQGLEEKISALQIEVHRQNNQRLQELEELQKRMAQLIEKNPEMEKRRIQLARLKSAKDLLPLWQKINEAQEEKKALETLSVQKQADLRALSLRKETAEKEAEVAQALAGEKECLLSEIASLQALSPLFEEQAASLRSIAQLQNAIAETEKNAAFADGLMDFFTLEEQTAKKADQTNACRTLLESIRQKNRLIPVYQRQKETYLQNYTLFFDAQAGILASTLRKKTPCPVCGSLEHPAPAALQSDPPSQEQLRSYHDAADQTSQQIFRLKERIEAQMQTLKDAVSLLSLPFETAGQQEEAAAKALDQCQLEEQAAHHQLDALKNDLRQKQIRLTNPPAPANKQAAQICAEDFRRKLEADQGTLRLQQTQLVQIRQKLPAQLNSLEDLVKKVKAVRERISQTETRLENARKHLQNILSQISLTKQTIDDMALRLKSLQEKIDTSQRAFFSTMQDLFPGGQQDFLDQLSHIGEIEAMEYQLQRHQLTITALAGQIDQLKSQLKSVKLISITDLQEQEKTYRTKIQTLREQVASLQQSLTNDTTHAKEIKVLYQKIEKAEGYCRQVNCLYRIANGNNEQRVSFERYVLGFYFDAIISFANRRLESLSDGRYLLCRKRDREKFGRSSGLDLEILDQYSGKSRPTSTLSGGESFQTALALALSLADVVQMYAGGVVIDTMFIDEGFGSLDAESLRGAVDSLLSLGHDGRLVGIISHVSQLKEQISCQIQVKAGNSGSSIYIQT
ncbi:MAG: SMC family ATPase [Oscillospiraceae bacterium]|nr:SMC family ATPase [Oscillospiraceae bacterium]